MKAVITDNRFLHIDIHGDTPLAIARTILFLGDPTSLNRNLPLLAEAHGLDADKVEADLLAEDGSLEDSTDLSGEAHPWLRANNDGPFTVTPTFTAENGDTISGIAHVSTTLNLGTLLGALTALCTPEAAEEVRRRLEEMETQKASTTDPATAEDDKPEG
jgi:hypothetical protein